MSDVAIVWFRNDLRLADHPALIRATESGARIVALYIYSPDEAAPWSPGDTSRCWLHHSLLSLAHSLEQRGNRLIIRTGNSLDVLTDIIKETGARHIFAHELCEPALRKRDEQITFLMAERDISFYTFNGNLLAPPGSITTKEGKPYRVFTPFWKSFQRNYTIDFPQATPNTIPRLQKTIASLTVDELELLPQHAWDKRLFNHWQPGENAAQKVLHSLDAQLVSGYPKNRDLPGTSGTTLLSPYLHFGELSPRQVAFKLEQVRNEHTNIGVGSGAESILRQLVWRDFSHHVLAYFPHTVDTPMNPRFESFPWQDNDRLLGAWQKGETGIPIVDAGMRELWHTGLMHNRVRMICASLLTKNMMIHWLEGARWFWDTLLDADLAQNSMNWQWVAGSGVDAAPYFRIFNPVTQGEKFDTKGTYIRRWVPELNNLPNKWIHKPWQAPTNLLTESRVRLDINYPSPVIDIAQSRIDALAAYKKHVRGTVNYPTQQSAA